MEKDTLRLHFFMCITHYKDFLPFIFLGESFLFFFSEFLRKTWNIFNTSFFSTERGSISEMLHSNARARGRERAKKCVVTLK